MGLFDKKYCDVCGEKIGLLGNRKLEDGNLCKDCAKKLSPFFSERKQSTVDEIKAQLAYREANKAELANFRPTRRFGENWMVMIDDTKGQFIVTHYDDYMKYNPDIINIQDVLSCNPKVKDFRTEVTYRNKEGEEVSYNPPRYKYRYDFYIEINVRHQYFSQIEIELNMESVEVISEPTTQGLGGFINSLSGGLTGGGDIHPEYNPEYRRYQCMADEIVAALMPGTQNAMPTGNSAYGTAASMGNNGAYGGAAPMGNNAYAANEAPVNTAWTCPYCNARNESGKFCQNCGAQKPAGM